MLIDLRPLEMDGLQAEKLLEKNNIIANRNSIPGDEKPLRPSGIRIGTPAVTSRGMKEKEMRLIANFIYRALIKKEDVKKDAINLCNGY